jgi:hypothetical protein
LRKRVTGISFPVTQHYSSRSVPTAPLSQTRAASAALAASFWSRIRKLAGEAPHERYQRKESAQSLPKIGATAPSMFLCKQLDTTHGEVQMEIPDKRVYITVSS